MLNKTYKLRYLPLFYDDLYEKVAYIKDVLNNVTAANDLLDSVEKAIIQRTTCAEAFEPYISSKDRKYPYYRIYVGNYTIYYVVINDEETESIMEVRRLLYNGQDNTKTI